MNKSPREKEGNKDDVRGWGEYKCCRAGKWNRNVVRLEEGI